MAKLSKILKSKSSNKLVLVRKPDGLLSTLPEMSLETMMSEHFPGSIVTDNPTVPPQRDDKVLVEPVSWITPQRTWAAINSFGPHKACGPNKLKPVVLQHLPREAVEALSNIFTAAIQLGYVPARWRISDVIFIDKPGKTDLENPLSFRPIFLMSFVYKTLEKVVAMDLEENTFKDNPMHEDQFGFVEGRSTEHDLSATVNEIEKGLPNKEFVITILLNIKDAFDNKKPPAIIKAMRKQGVRQNVCNMYKQYLTNRRCLCTLSDKATEAILIMGSPQGGIHSTSRGWNCAMNKLLTRLRKTKTHYKAFADDGALITSYNKLSEAMKDAQKAITVAVEWAKEMGVEFTVGKIVVMLFTNKRATSYQMPNSVKLYGQEIPFSKMAKYLGVTLDYKLS
jgi:hypothetical protein